MTGEDVSKLRSLSIPFFAMHAHRLMRVGEVSGEAALALIIWPDPTDMRTYVHAEQRSFDEWLDDLMVA